MGRSHKPVTFLRCERRVSQLSEITDQLMLHSHNHIMADALKQKALLPFRDLQNSPQEAGEELVAQVLLLGTCGSHFLCSIMFWA